MTDRSPAGSRSQAVTYEGVRQILSRPPDRRKDFEINNILPWFRSMKETKVLGLLKPSILFDVIKHVQFVAMNKDELIMRQGEQGDCMYVMLRGRVTIYHNYGVLGDGTGEDGDAAVAQSVATVKGEQLRQQLGAFVVTLANPGSAFGEVSLLSDNGTRSASIITDEPTDLIKIDRALYGRSVQSVLRREFEQKANFIAQHPHFQGWAAKYRKQLTMALEKEFLSYDFVVTKQGAPVDAIYFIVTGEIKMSMDPQQHFSQYQKLFASYDAKTTSSTDPVSQVLRTFNNNNNNIVDDGTGSNCKRPSRRHQSVEVCLLGVNESVGDIEALMGLSTYMQTSVCSQPCEVLVLNMKHFDRLLVRRNPKTIDRMREELDLRIRSRIASRYLTSAVPLIDRLLERAASYQKRPVSDPRSELMAFLRSNDKRNNPSRPSDAHAPGALFYRIRQQQQSTNTTNNKSPVRNVVINNLGEIVPANDEILAAVPLSPPSDAAAVDGLQVVTSSDQFGQKQHSASLTDVESADVDVLESRMLEWLIDDGKYRRIQQHHHQLQQQHGKSMTPRITKLRRASSECEQQLKPGARIVLRRKQIVVSPYRYNSRERSARLTSDDSTSDNEQEAQKKQDCSDAQLAYYRSALTDPVPVFART